MKPARVVQMNSDLWLAQQIELRAIGCRTEVVELILAGANWVFNCGADYRPGGFRSSNIIGRQN